MSIQANGSCLCGTLRFRVSGPLQEMAHCHCHYCRKAHGAAFVTWVVVPKPQFAWVKGQSDVRWHHSSEQSRRGFCSQCGSTIFFESTLCPGEIHVTRANLGEGDWPMPKWNTFVEQRVPWAPLDETLTPLEGTSETLAKYNVIPPPKTEAPPDEKGK
jgi:hypothetical protein